MLSITYPILQPAYFKLSISDRCPRYFSERVSFQNRNDTQIHQAGLRANTSLIRFMNFIATC